jgi:Leucine-rich repeat (LRR) protein
MKSLPQQSTRKKQQIGKMVVKSHYFTPQEAEIPAALQSINTRNHVPIPVNMVSLLPAPETHKQNNKTELDGFYLLEAAGLDFPEDLQNITLTGHQLKTVVDEDLTYFSELFYLDVSENFLPFTPFGALPKLKELRIACNFLTAVDDLYGFNMLMYLDLSYNQLTAESIFALSVLPMLKELDISGNNLSTLPPDLSNFQCLEKLLLEYNKFDNNKIFQILGTIPNIRYISLANNYLSFIPRESCEYGGLRLLETLDLAFNFFSSEDSIEAVILLSRLTTLMLYGNPLLGPTGEDPMFIYIETLVDKASEVRQSAGSSIADIDFITEVPRKRVLKKGVPLGRLALYRDFSIVQVDPDHPQQKERKWKKRNVSTPFVDAMNTRRVGAQSPGGQVGGDFTFITNSLVTSSQTLNSPHGKKTHISGLREDDTNAIADDVMKKVASEMGLVGTNELALFDDYATLPKT